MTEKHRAQADFLEFLKKGKLPFLSLGLPREAVKRLMGAPDYWSDKDSGNPIAKAWAFYYGDCMITFEKDLLFSITIPIHFAGTRSFDWIGYFPQPNLNPDNFRNRLVEHGIAYTNLRPSNAPVMDAELLTEGGVFVCVRSKVEGSVGPDGTYISKREMPVIDTFVLQENK